MYFIHYSINKPRDLIKPGLPRETYSGFTWGKYLFKLFKINKKSNKKLETMKTIIRILFLCGIIVFTALSCEKNNPGEQSIGWYSIKIDLVDKNNTVIQTFEQGDTVVFNFYLKNQSDEEITYKRPCGELCNFLRVYKRVDDKEEYNYIGKPSLNCTANIIIDKIGPNKTKLIGIVRLPSTIVIWPEMDSGSYYVGDTLRISVNDWYRNFISRLYFKIE